MEYNPYANTNVASISTLPTEISEQIYNYLTPAILTRLARVNKALYASVQSPLYRHASIRSFEKLKLFVWTLNNVAMFDRWGEGAISKNVVTMDISVDPNATEAVGGSRPTAVLLSRFISAIGRYCPSVRITLRIYNGSCTSQPISSFKDDTFGNVTKLILHVGVPAYNSGESRTTSGPSASLISQVIPVRRFNLHDFTARAKGTCSPNSKFWIGIFNGQSFPDLKEVEIKHDHGIPQNSPQNLPQVRFNKGDLKGLDNVTRLVVESTPELNDSVLMGALNCAKNLKKLDLRNIAALSYKALSDLLPHALPNLSHFTLHISSNHHNSSLARRQLENYQPLAPSSRDNQVPIHLCPLFRTYAKGLEFLDLKAPYICRDLFLDETEKLKLTEAGVKVDIAGNAGDTFINSSGEAQRIDRIAIEEIIKTFRKQKEEKRFREAVHANLVAKGAKKGPDGTYGAAVTGAEYEEEQKRVQRTRKIREQGWKRIVRIGQDMCRSGESWEEMGVLAGLEEENAEWLLGNEVLGYAIRAGKGQVDIEMKFEEAFPNVVLYPGDVVTRRNRNNHGHDFNDDA